MRIIISIIMFNLLAFNSFGMQPLAPLKISVVSQKRVQGQSDNPFANRSITFQVTNNTNDNVYVHGFNSTFGFFPIGFLSRFDAEKRAWVRPDGKTASPSYEEVKKQSPDTYLLRPKESLRFTDLTEEFYVGNKFRRIFFISQGSKDHLEVKTSPEFILK